MRFMNEYAITSSAERWEDHPVLGPATKTLASLMDAVNRNSDGWAYWGPPVQAAARLMELVERDGTARYLFDRERADTTEAELRKAYTQLKRFRAKHPGVPFTIYGPGGDPEPSAEPEHVTRQARGHKITIAEPRYVESTDRDAEIIFEPVNSNTHHRQGVTEADLDRLGALIRQRRGQLVMTPEQAAMYAERGRRLTEVRKLHRREAAFGGEHSYCAEDRQAWPCRTIAVIEGTE